MTVVALDKAASGGILAGSGGAGEHERTIDGMRSDRRKNDRDRDGKRGGGFRGRGKRVSILTQDPTLVVDYKDVNLLRKFTSPEGKILPRRITKCTAKQQRQITQAVKRARHLALLPYAEIDS